MQGQKNKKGVSAVNKFLILLVLGVMLGSTGVLGAWVFGYTGISKAEVVDSGQVLLASNQFADIQLNTTEGADTQVGAVNITIGRSVLANVSISLEVREANALCPYENDCVDEVYWEGNLINNNTVLNMTAGTSTLTRNITCIQNSCNVNRTLTVDLFEA